MLIGLVFGKSMKPTLGVVTFVWGTEPDLIAVGDVVCFNRGKYDSIMHRVIDIDTHGTLYIKGDNAPEIDHVPFTDVQFKLKGFKKIL